MIYLLLSLANNTIILKATNLKTLEYYLLYLSITLSVINSLSLTNLTY